MDWVKERVLATGGAQFLGSCVTGKDRECYCMSVAALQSTKYDPVLMIDVERRPMHDPSAGLEPSYSQRRFRSAGTRQDDRLYSDQPKQTLR